MNRIHGPGNAKITQLISCFFTVENVRELDISVDDVRQLTAGQGSADVNAQLEDFSLVQTAGLPAEFFHTFQEFHADQDRTNAFVPKYGVIFNCNDMRGAFQLHHHIDLAAYIAYKLFQRRI